jgi:hypothetical protein
MVGCLMALSLVLASCVTPAKLIPFCGNEWFLLGINYPWINYGHDFGTTAWGHIGVSEVLNEGWQHQTYYDSQGITRVRRSSERTYTGEYSLQLITQIVGGDPNISKGEAFVDLRHHAPSGVDVPANLEGVTLRCWIYAPWASGGESDHLNGLQIFVKDENWHSEYGTWVNITEGQWNEVTLTPSRQTPHWGSMDKGFDPTRIIMIGVKVAVGSGSTAQYDGAFYMDTFKVGDEVWFDFESPSTAEEDFEEIAGCGIRVVRWFVFADGRASPEFDNNGMVVGFDDFFYDDMDAALEAAQKYGIYLILVLFDFHLCDTAEMENEVQVGGHADLITDPAKRQSFIDNALEPMLSRYGGHPNILAWEVMNEPELAMMIDGGGEVGQPVSVETMQDFVRIIAQHIKETPERLVTLGSVSREWLNLWTDAGLDFYQYHYYDYMEQEMPFDIPYEELELDKPCILGEFPTKDSNISVQAYLEKAWENDLAGVLGWSFRAGDKYSQFLCTPFDEWRQTHADAPVDIICGP